MDENEQEFTSEVLPPIEGTKEPSDIDMVFFSVVAPPAGCIRKTATWEFDIDDIKAAVDLIVRTIENF